MSILPSGRVIGTQMISGSSRIGMRPVPESQPSGIHRHDSVYRIMGRVVEIDEAADEKVVDTGVGFLITMDWPKPIALGTDIEADGNFAIYFRDSNPKATP